MSSIVIVDYGMGNVSSVEQALRAAAPECTVRISGDKEDILAADRVVLPGQGAMPDCMRHLQESGLDDVVRNVATHKPLFGICVGKQMLFDWSEEGDTAGLGLIPGRVRRFQLEGSYQPDGSRFKVPQMGWNRVHQTQDHPMWQGIKDGSYFYFVHSYYVSTGKEYHIAGQTNYGHLFTCAVVRDNIFATQFHPEKSADSGLQLWRNFVNWNP